MPLSNFGVRFHGSFLGASRGLPARGAVALVAEGRVERQGEVVHLQISRLQDLSKALSELGSVSRNSH